MSAVVTALWCGLLCASLSGQQRLEGTRPLRVAQEGRLDIAFVSAEWTEIPVMKADRGFAPDLLAAFGFSKGKGTLVLLTCKGENRSIRALQTAAEDGDSWAQLCLAGLLCGTKAKAADQAAGVTWLRRAADAGYTPAIYNLGALRLAGEDPQSGTGEAERLFRTAAAASGSQASRLASAAAKFMMGRMYYLGAVLPQNLVEAYAWWTLALQSGELPKTDLLSGLQQRMSPTQIQEAQRRARELGAQ